MAPPNRPNPRRAKRYRDTLPDDSTLGSPSPPGSSSAIDKNEAHTYHHRDDYNSQGDHNPASDQEEEDNGDWYWQCHLCAHLNPQPPLYKDFSAVPLAISQPCGNKDVPLPEPTYSSRPVGPEKESLESRMRALELEAQRREKEDKGEEQGGDGSWGKSAYQKLLEAVPPLAGPGSVATRARARAGTEAGEKGASGASTGPSETPTKTAEAAEAVTATASSPTTAGITDPAPLQDYAFSTASNNLAGPSKPIRHRGVTSVRAWPGLGAMVPPRVASGYVRGDDVAASESLSPQAVPAPGATLALPGTAGLASGNYAAAGSSTQCRHRRCEGCYDLDANKQVVRFCGGGGVGPRMYAAWYAGFGFVEGIDPPVVDGGLRVRQREWVRGADIPELCLGGESDGDLEAGWRGSMSLREYKEYKDMALGRTLGEEAQFRGVNEVGEERFLIRGEDVLVGRNESGALEMRRDGPSRAQTQARRGSPVRYAVGESRILLVKSAEGSDDESQADKAAKASSDEGEGFFGERGDGDGDEGEESSSDGGSHGWIEPITFIHRGSQEGGGCSESGSDEDEDGDDGDDEREEAGTGSEEDAHGRADEEEEEEEESEEEGRAKSDIVGQGAFDRRQAFAK